MSTFSATPSSLTREEEAIILDEFSTDGTWATVDDAELLHLFATNDTSRVTSLGLSMDDVVLGYTIKTGAFPSAWDPELVDPELVDELEEWADLAVSDDLEQDIRDFIALVSPEPGLATALGGERTLTATEVGDMVTTLNDYWTASVTDNSDTPEVNYENAINTAFAMGAGGLAIILILAGFTDENGDKVDGFADIIAEGQENVTEEILDATERMDELNEEISDASDDTAEANGELTALKNEYDLESSKMSMRTQLLTTMQTMISTLVDVGTKMSDLTYSTNQKINA